ncbi:ABC transporter ATP-binding protein [bacterium]|nr:ABC transporter ATP-binding protein [bacterium]
MLSVRGLQVSYGAVRALHGISFDVRQGEIVTLIGANGAGKSTTLNTIMGLVRARGGEVIYKGGPITNQQTFQIVRQGLALSPEGRRIFLNLTVRENLEIGSLVTPDAQTKKRLLDEVYELFPRIRERLRQIAGTLSGGEQQMLAISRAMMQNPQLLLLDEPSLGLAPNLVQEIFAKIRFLNSEGKTILLVEQNAYQALRICQRAHVLEQGRIVMSGTGDELRNNPKVKEAYLGG